MKNYALVYLVNNDPTGQLKDVGNDPCFDTPPSWGICRPDIRNEKLIGKGSRLLFIARVFEKDRSRKYYIKGYFRIEKKINIVDAFNKFKNRQNIIISKGIRDFNNKWDNKDWETKFLEQGFETIPDFIREFRWKNLVYYQKSSDDHGLDNWKCGRIYNCNIMSFSNCLKIKGCIKEKCNHELKRNYILGDPNSFEDWNTYRVEWKELAKLINKPESLMIANRHPEVELTDDEMDTIISYMNKKAVANTRYK